MRKIKWGIISTAQIGINEVIPAMQQGQFSEVTAICSRNLESAQAAARKMGLHNKFMQLANMCSSEVVVPEDVKCCGFAGDRGFNFPELNESALRSNYTYSMGLKYSHG